MFTDKNLELRKMFGLRECSMSRPNADDLSSVKLRTDHLFLLHGVSV
jgi:hypothetical protein